MLTLMVATKEFRAVFQRCYMGQFISPRVWTSRQGFITVIIRLYKNTWSFIATAVVFSVVLLPDLFCCPRMLQQALLNALEKEKPLTSYQQLQQ